MTLDEIAAAAETAGLSLRGGFALEPSERVGPLAQTRAIVLLGVVGARNWPPFAASPERQDGEAHPLDRWSRRLVTGLAARFGALPLFPFEGPPYWPFPTWARRAEPVSPSPLGLLIHPLYGLWHSYRGALAFQQAFDLPAYEPAPSPCAACAERPCLKACPTGAFSPSGYDVAACAAWLKRPEGGDCMSGGCRARRACHVGTDYAQSAEQSRFHIEAFLAARG